LAAANIIATFKKNSGATERNLILLILPLATVPLVLAHIQKNLNQVTVFIGYYQL
jgi:hypothetical protein